MRMTVTNLSGTVRQLDVLLANGQRVQRTIPAGDTAIFERVDPFAMNTNVYLREDPTLDVTFAFDATDIPSILTLYGGDIQIERDSNTVEAAARVLNLVNASVVSDGPNRVTVDLGASPGLLAIPQHRQFVELSGVQDGANQVFTLPEVAIHSTSQGLQVKVYLNGLLLRPGSTRDYVVSESGGVGTGYDTITFLNDLAPKSRDSLWADYVVPAL